VTQAVEEKKMREGIEGCEGQKEDRSLWEQKE